jgi:WS/DGAT/MGAT family acyltransferase
VQQLTALDVMFSSLDTETTNGVLGGLVLHEPPPDGRPAATAAFMRQRFAERLPYLPPLHRELVKVPIGLDHDYLGQPDRIDLLDHIRSISLPAPGTHDQLAAEVSRIMSTSLPTGRPLWDYTVIEGLADGSVAHLLRIHHLVIDGGSMPTLWDLLSDEPTQPFEPLGDTTRRMPRWGKGEMLARELGAVAAKPVAFAAFQAKFLAWIATQTKDFGPLAPLALPFRMSLPGALAQPAQALFNPVLRERGIAEIQPYIPTLRTPRTPFNNRVTAQRTFVFADLPLAQFRDTGKALGGTINDVVLGVCAGALRRYLLENNVPTDDPLIVCVPVSLRTGTESTRWANYVHMIFAPLPTHLDDPLARVRAASAAVKAAKGNFDAMPVGLIREASRFIPSAMFNVMTRVMVKMPDALSKGPWNVVVSNVRGPSTAAYMDGVRIKGYWPASFLSVGGGINITLQSYTDRICFGFMGAPEQVGDLRPLIGYMTDALAETVAAAGGIPSTVAPPALHV